MLKQISLDQNKEKYEPNLNKGEGGGLNRQHLRQGEGALPLVQGGG